MDSVTAPTPRSKYSFVINKKLQFVARMWLRVQCGSFKPGEHE